MVCVCVVKCTTRLQDTHWISDLPRAMDDHIVRGIPVFKLSVGLHVCVCVVRGNKCVHMCLCGYKNMHHRIIVCVCVCVHIYKVCTLHFCI